MRLIKSQNIEFLKQLDGKKFIMNQFSNEPTKLIDDDFTYDDEIVGNRPTQIQFGNEPTDAISNKNFF